MKWAILFLLYGTGTCTNGTGRYLDTKNKLILDQEDSTGLSIIFYIWSKRISMSEYCYGTNWFDGNANQNNNY